MGAFASTVALSPSCCSALSHATKPLVDLGLGARVRDLRRAEADLVPEREHANAVRVAAVNILLGERLGQHRVVRRDALRARGDVSSWPKIRKVAHAFWSEYRYKSLQFAQLQSHAHLCPASSQADRAE